MKILMITNHSYMFYRFRKELVEKLLENSEVIISTPFVGHENDLKDMGCQMIETKIDRRGINPVTDLKLMKKYAQLIKETKPDKVITYSIKPNIYAGIICRFRNIPYYANVQGLGTAFQKMGLAQFVTCLYKFALKKVNAVFFENQGNANEFTNRKIIPTEKITILNGAGINLEQFKYEPYPKNEKIHFLYLGRIMKEKGIDELFDSIKKFDQQDVVLDIVGFYEDDYEEKIKSLEAKKLAIFHGFQENPIPYYQNADCVVLPSYHEGMSNVLLEAAAIGRPIITSDIPGCREAVEPNVTGYLCEVKNNESLYEKMKLFYELSYEQREEMGKQARRKMEKEFDKQKIVNQTIEVINKEWKV